MGKTGREAMNCERVRNLMAEYIGQALDYITKEEVAVHIDSCDSCFKEIKELDRAILALEGDCRTAQTLPDFLNGIEEKVLKGIKPRIRFREIIKSKKTIWAASAAAVIALIVITFMSFAPLNLQHKVYSAATFGRVYSSNDGTFGKKLNISSASSNIKITATKISADDMGTIIYFNVDGPDDEYYPEFSNIKVKEKLIDTTLLGTRPYTGALIQKGGFMLYLGSADNNTKFLHISFSDMNYQDDTHDRRATNGEWSFILPVEKIHSVTCDLNKAIDVDGYGIKFEKLVSGPTGTYLLYNYASSSPEKFFSGINTCELVSGKQRYRQLSSMGISPDPENSQIKRFETMYPDNPGRIAINIGNYYESVKYMNPIKVPVSIGGLLPVNFKYRGNTITIDNLNNDSGTVQFEMVEQHGGRNYISADPSFEGQDGTALQVNSVSQKFYVLDEDNVEYNDDDIGYDPKYQGKNLEFYPTDTVYSFQMQNKGMKYFNIVIKDSINICKVNKSVILKQ